MLFSWQPPTVPNGIIVAYRLNITNLDTNTYNIINTTSDVLSYNATGFMPFQSYVASVSAATSAGFGPEAVIRSRQFGMHV